MRFLAKVSVAIALCGNAFVAGAQAAPAGDVDVLAPLGDLAVTLPLLVDRLHAGELTVHKAWEAGELSLGDALYLLGHASDWGAIEGRDNVPLRHALVRLILEQDKGRLEKLKQTPAKARLWIGEYLQVQRDERAVQVLESVLSELKAPVADYSSQALLFQSIERLGWFHQGRGESVKAAQTWLRLPPLMSEANWMVPDALIGAARAYATDGQEDKARELYAQVPQYGADYFTTLARLDPARKLMSEGKHALARVQMEQAVKSATTEESRATLFSLLSYSYRLTGEWGQAKRLAGEAIKRFEALPADRRGGNSQSTESLARNTLNEAASWVQSPIRVEPRQLDLQTTTNRTQAIVRRLRVRTSKPAVLRVSSSSPQVKALVVGVDGWGESDTSEEQVVVVEVALGAPTHVVLTITSEQYPNYEAKVPVLSGVGLEPNSGFQGDAR